MGESLLGIVSRGLDLHNDIERRDLRLPAIRTEHGAYTGGP